MPETTDNNDAQTTADGQEQKTGATKEDSGAETQSADQKKQPQFQPLNQQQTDAVKEAKEKTEATQPKEKTFTQADVDRIVQDRLKKAVKSELKKLTGETDGQPTVDDLQRQLNDYQSKTRTLESREQVRDFLTDPRNKINVRTENIRAIEKLVFSELEFDEDGKPSNLRDAIDLVKSEAPTLFVSSSSSINGASGKQAEQPFNWNDQIRAAAGYKAR